MAQQNNSRGPSGSVGIGGILLRAALILLCLILLCIHLMGNLYAKYATSGDGADDARVAKFDVTVIGAPEDLVVTCVQAGDQEATYTINVTNESEVAVKYDVFIVYKTPVDGVLPNIDTKAGTVQDGGWYFTDVGTLPVGTSSADHNLTFTVNWANFTAPATGSSVYKEFSFTATIYIEQID